MSATAVETATEAGLVRMPPAEQHFVRIPIENLVESPENPRTHYDPAALAQLATDLQTVGQMTPIIVRPHPTQRGKFELAAGHRRTRAATRAGLDALDAIVRPYDDRQMIEVLNFENFKRDDLDPIEEARGLRALMEKAGYDVERLAERMSLSTRTVYDKLALLRLIPEAQDLIARGVLSPAHGALLVVLPTADQKRALQSDAALEAEHVSPEHFAGASELPLGDRRKARTVRELKQWIDDHVRFEPDKVEQADLAMYLPASAAALEEAKASRQKVVKITRDFRVPYEAKANERTYGRNAWKRADGEPELIGRHGEVKRTAAASKTCEFSRPGIVVAGPGRGEVFLVCIARDKCTTHWGAEMKERERMRAAHARESGGTATTERPSKPKVDPKVLPEALREEWTREELKGRTEAISNAVHVLIDELTGLPDEIAWNLAVNAELNLTCWLKVGVRDWGNDTSDWEEVIETLVAPMLPGKFKSAKELSLPTNAAGARTLLAWWIWLARDSAKIDRAVEAAVEKRWEAKRKADAMVHAIHTTGSAKASKAAAPAKKPVKIAAKKAG